MMKLFTPLKVHNLELKNRLILPPMATAKAEEDGSMSQEILDYYHEKTESGHLAMVIVEHSFISEEGRANKRQLSVSEDRMVEGLRKLSETLHANGTLAVMQINHAGVYARPSDPSTLPFSPSPVEDKEARILKREDIEKIIQDFAAAARRSKEAGFDAVEIHSAHGYLLNQFYSPLINKREDEYGGSLDNRIRIHVEVLRAVREVVGKDFPVFMRLGASDYKEGGTTLEDSLVAAKVFQKETLDLLDVSGGFSGYVHPEVTEQGYFHELTRALKEEISIPVILTGGITDLSAAERLLKDDRTDLIGIGRAIYKDSSWLKNAVNELKNKENS